MANQIDTELEKQIAEEEIQVSRGPISEMAKKYVLSADNLLGFVLKVDFNETHFITCDAWKRKCGGVSRGSFILFRIDQRSVDPEDAVFTERLILARIQDSAPTPVEFNIQQTLFQVHKLQAQPDPITAKEFQWGALKASIVGTFFDENGRISFGNDVDTFFSPFAYVAYMPTTKDLSLLINSFVDPSRAITIGRLRYTETPSPHSGEEVPISIDPKDIVGETNAANRMAVFGKTRFGKSNANKLISHAIFQSGLDVSQVFFDPSGEYTYVNEQDGTSLFALHADRSVRYSIRPRPTREDERALGLPDPQPLAVNFYAFPGVGHSMIRSLWSTENNTPPQYLRPVLDMDLEDRAPDPRGNQSAYNHYWRTMGMWFALLSKAGFSPPSGLTAPINFRDQVKEDLVDSVHGISVDTQGRFNERGQPIVVLPALYQRLARLYKEHPDWFPPSTDGSPYFNDAEEKLLRMLSDPTIAAHNYIRPFNRYHNVRGSSIFEEIADHVANGRSVFIDMAQSNETVRDNLVERICREIFRKQNEQFASDEGLGERFVMFYFEEAHRLFNKDDSDLNSIYNILAKEGAKMNIAMVFATQSMTTISPDLIKNTDNFLVAHLDDDREVKEVARKYAFQDVAEDVRRIQSKGFVRMITKSHRFALPVQLHRFSDIVRKQG